MENREAVGNHIIKEIHEKHLTERLALSVDVVRTSGPLKRGGMVDFPM